MHDGYVYTFAVCDAVDGPAPQVVNRLLAALPPVKRAAFFSAVDAALVDAVLTELADAELFLVVVALDQGTDQLRELATALAARTGDARGAAVIVGVGSGDATRLTSTAAALVDCGLRIVGQVVVNDVTPELLMVLRRAYADARSGCAVPPLPADWREEER